MAWLNLTSQAKSEDEERSCEDIVDVRNQRDEEVQTDVNVNEKEKSATKSEDTEQGTRSSILNWLNLGKTENKTEDVESFKSDDIPNDAKQESDIRSSEKSAEQNVS